MAPFLGETRMENEAGTLFALMRSRGRPERRPPRAYTVDGAAREIGVSERVVRLMLSAGVIVASVRGGERQISASEIRRVRRG